MDTPIARSPAQSSFYEMSAYEFAALGVNRVIYVRRAERVALPEIKIKKGYAVFAGDGTYLKTVQTMTEITAVAAQHDLEIVPVQ